MPNNQEQFAFPIMIFIDGRYMLIETGQDIPIQHSFEVIATNSTKREVDLCNKAMDRGMQIAQGALAGE